MNAGEWLRSRTPRPPSALTDRLDALLADAYGPGMSDIQDTLLNVSERLLRDLLREGQSSRESALDLLAADALITYLMEVAAEHIETLDARAEGAMLRISAIEEAASAAV